jgi:hypothetical protein
VTSAAQLSLYVSGRTGCDGYFNRRQGHISSLLYHVAIHGRGEPHTPFAMVASIAESPIHPILARRSCGR